MPDRFTEFSPGQAEQLRHEFGTKWKRTALLISILAIGMAVGFGWALKGIHDASDRGDRASARAAAVNRRLIRDANVRAEASKAAAAKSAHTAYAACRRQQESVTISRQFFHLILPHHLAGRPPEAQQAISDFYNVLTAHHALTIPTCQKPPKGD